MRQSCDDLFTLSWAAVNRLDLDGRPVDVGAVIRRRVRALAPLAWERERVEVVALQAKPVRPTRLP